MMYENPIIFGKFVRIDISKEKFYKKTYFQEYYFL